MAYVVPLNERETIINFSRVGRGCSIYTSDDTVMTKLDKLCESSKHYSLVREGKISGSVVDKSYYLDDKSLVSFRASKSTRTLTDEQRKAASDRMKEYQKNKKAESDGN